jgi:hypothetical protein
MAGVGIVDNGKGTGNGMSVSADNRADISARSNPRIYYISRDKERAYTWFFEDDDAAAGDYVAYLQNNDSNRTLVIDDIIISTEFAATIKAHVVTGTASGGASITPTNLNLSSTKSALATARGTGAISGLTSSGVFDALRLSANDTVELKIGDALQLGNNDAIAIEYDTGTTGDCEVTILGYFEDPITL